jgi:protein-tyrosine kinase
MGSIELPTRDLRSARANGKSESGARLPDEVQEYYRAILLGLSWPDGGGPGTLRTLGITSCGRCEGTSTVASQLSATAAGVGSGPVLLVDANLFHPAVARTFRAWRGPGLVETLRDGLEPAETIQPGPVQNLCLLTAGKLRGNVAKAYDWPALPGLVETLKDKFDLVVFDLPPIGQGVAALRLGRLLDGVVFVVEAERVRWEAAQRAKRLLVRANARLLGAVLNKSP